MTLFRGVASFYARFRAGYPQALFDHLIAVFELDATTLVVDAGTGTGQLAIPLAARGVPVLAFDPEPEMLAEARARAVAARPPGRIAFVEGRAEDLLELAPPPVRLVAFGASFHWTDRDRVLALCDQLVEPRGGVAVISGGPAVTPAWSRVVDEVVATFLGPRRRAGDGFYEHPPERHEQVLARSALSLIHI